MYIVLQSKSGALPVKAVVGRWDKEEHKVMENLKTIRHQLVHMDCSRLFHN
jgi:hypothetical protein